MRQRAMIAMAICNDPEVLIADEPTTTLDVTIQAQMLESHPPGEGAADERPRSSSSHTTSGSSPVVATGCACSMRAAAPRSATSTTSSRTPGHPYTVGLLSSIPTWRRQPAEADPGVAAEHARASARLCIPATVRVLGRDLRGPGARTPARRSAPSARRATSASSSWATGTSADEHESSRSRPSRGRRDAARPPRASSIS